MENYKLVYELMSDLISVETNEGPFEARQGMMHHVEEGLPDPVQKKAFLSQLKAESEAAMSDPTFDWVKVGAETGFNESLPDDPTWPYNYESWVKNTFAYIVHDAIYPDKILTESDLYWIARCIVFLVLETEGYREWVTVAELAEQLAKMSPKLSFIKPYCFIGDISIFSNGLLTVKMDNTGLEKWAIQANPDDIYFEETIDLFKKGQLIYLTDIFMGWPPFSSDKSSPIYMEYDRDAWLGLTKEGDSYGLF